MASNVPPFEPHMTLKEAAKLRVNDKIDHRDEVGRFVYGTVWAKNGTNLKIHYDGWSRKWDKWCDFQKEIHRFAKPGSISQRRAHRFTDLKVGDYVDVNPTQRHSGWTCAEIRRLDPKTGYGQVQVVYENNDQNYLYWTHLDNIYEIAEFTTKAGLNNVNQQQPIPQKSQKVHEQKDNQQQRVQEIVKENPQMLAAMVAQLAQENPQLLAAIQQNPQALQQVLQDPNIMQQLMGMMTLQQMQSQSGGNANPSAAMFGQSAAAAPSKPGVIQVTQKEKEAIDRLQAMGFSESQAVEAYMVFGKNEELATNYLFDNPDLGGFGGGAVGALAHPQQHPQHIPQQPQQMYDLLDSEDSGWGFDQNPEEWDKYVIMQWIGHLNEQFQDDYEANFARGDITGENFKRQQLGNAQWCQNNLGMKPQTAEIFVGIVRQRITKYENIKNTQNNDQVQQQATTDEIDAFLRIRSKRFPKYPNEQIDNAYSIGDKLQVRDTQTYQWLDATIIDKENNWIVVHFDGWSSKYDQKIHAIKHNKRLRPIQNLQNIENKDNDNNDDIADKIKNDDDGNSTQTEMEMLRNELNETRAANLRQQNMIKQLRQQIGDENAMNIKQNVVNLTNKMINFGNKYDQNELSSLYQQSPDNIMIDQEIESLKVAAKVLIKKASDMQSYIVSLNKPNPSGYKVWDLDMMMKWIESLENGRFLKYSVRLKKGFESDGMLSGSVLPILSKSDLREKPFEITHFEDRNALYHHFKSLQSQNNNDNDDDGKQQMQNEGSHTAYISH